MTDENIRNEIEQYLKIYKSRERQKAYAALLGRGAAQIPALISILEGPAVDEYRLTEVQYVSLEILAAIGEPSIDPLLKLLDGKNRAQYISGICAALVKIGPVCIRKVADQLLHDDRSEQRCALVRIMAGIANGEALNLLQHIVQHNAPHDEYVRGLAAELLSRMDNEEALGIVGWLIDDPLPRIKMYAAKALGKLRHKSAVEPLITVLLDRDGKSGHLKDVRINAAWALGQIGDPKAVPALLELIVNRAHPTFSPALESSIVALGLLQDRRAAKPLIKLLRDKSLKKAERIAVCYTLGILKDQGALPVLTRLAEKGREEERAYAIGAIGKIGAPWTIDTIREALCDDSLLVCEEAVIALGTMGSVNDVPGIIQAAKMFEQENDLSAQEKVSFTGNICSAIAKIGVAAVDLVASEYVSILDYDYGSAYNLNRSYWVPTLRQIGEASIKPFIKLIEDEEAKWSEREMAINILGELGLPAAVGPLRRFYSTTEDEQLKEAVIKALRAIAYHTLAPLYVMKGYSHGLDREPVPEVANRLVDDLLKVDQSQL